LSKAQKLVSNLEFQRSHLWAFEEGNPLFLDLEEKKVLLLINVECEELIAKKMQSFMLHRVVVVVVVVALLLVCMLQADAASGTRRILEEPKIRLKTEYPFEGRNSFANQELHFKADGGGDEESVEEPPGGTNSRPLIGILSQPTCGEKTRESERNWDSAPSSSSSSSSSNRSCIAASYVKFVESGGARAVPILYNEPEDSLIQVFVSCKFPIPFVQK
jgi:hypothetical protein